jgi:sigma-B regulation protein RsbU (phosphoserine phosphatase)
MSTPDGSKATSLRSTPGLRRRADPATEPVRAESAESEDAARFFELSLDLLCTIGFDGYCKQVSPSCERLLGYTRQECCRRTFLDLVHPDDRDNARNQLDRLGAGVRLVRFDSRHLGKDGSTPRVSWTVVSAPEKQRAYGIGRIVSEQESHEQELRQAQRELQRGREQRDRFRISEQKLQIISDSALDAVVMIDQQGQVVHWNPAAERMFGYRAEEIQGAIAHETLVPASHVARARQGWTRFVETGEGPAVGRVLQLSAVRKNGDEFPIEIAVSSFRVEQQWWAAAIIRDISERVRTEKTLRERDIQLLAVQRMQQHLLPDQPPVVPGLDVAGATYPAQFAAGDHYDYLQMPAGWLGVVVSDVSGHGFAPALLVASTQTLLQVLAKTRTDVGQILTDANAFLASGTEDERFVTVFLGQIDPEARTFTYASAGHQPGYILGEGGEIKAVLESTSIPLAVLPDISVPKADPVPLASGDTIVLLTDGVIDARSAGDESFGKARALDVVRAHQERTSREIIDRLYRAVCDFTGSDTLWDDVTAMIVKVGPRD